MTSSSTGTKLTQRTDKEKGLVLIWTALLLITVVGMLGLGIDIGRLYIAQGEIQNYADAAAFSAALQLNGLQSGISRAQTSAGALPNRWDFSTKDITGSQRTVYFAVNRTASAGQWYTSPANVDLPNIAYVKVKVNVPVPMYFAPILGAAYNMDVAAESIAGKETASTIAPGNLVPFASIAPNVADTGNFGFVFGTDYTLRWSSNIGNNNEPPNGSTCAGDLALGWGSGSTIARQRDRDPARGYWGSNSAGELTDWIENGYPNSIEVGDTITVVSGEKNGTKRAMDNRVESDADHSSTTYTAYENPNGARTGNGRRIVAVPIISGTAGHSGEETVLGIAAFFLNSLDYGGTHGNEPFCATYIGSYAQGANTHSGGGSAAVTKIRLVSNR